VLGGGGEIAADCVPLAGRFPGAEPAGDLLLGLAGRRSRSASLEVGGIRRSTRFSEETGSPVNGNRNWVACEGGLVDCPQPQSASNGPATMTIAAAVTAALRLLRIVAASGPCLARLMQKARSHSSLLPSCRA
jgi:hypothetical protein